MHECIYVCCMCMYICVYAYVCSCIAHVDMCVCVSYVCLVIFTQMTECAEHQRAHPRGFRQQLQRSLSLTYTISVSHFLRL